MTHVSRSLLISSALVLALLSAALPARAMEGAALERGTAIIDPLALRELDLGEHRASRTDRVGFGLRPFFPTRPSALVSPLTGSCSIASCSIPRARGSCWLESSTAWTVPMCRQRPAARSG